MSWGVRNTSQWKQQGQAHVRLRRLDDYEGEWGSIASDMFQWKCHPIGRRRPDMNNGDGGQLLLGAGRYKIGQGHEAHWDSLPCTGAKATGGERSDTTWRVLIFNAVSFSHAATCAGGCSRGQQEAYSIVWTRRMEE
jgi:hypothetical protein